MMEEGILVNIAGAIIDQVAGRNPCYDGRGYFSQKALDALVTPPSS